MLILLSLLAADPETMMKVADDRQAMLREAVAKPVNTRYRLDPRVTVPPDGKDDALAITGADCERIGNLYCTTKPRMLYSVAY